MLTNKDKNLPIFIFSISLLIFVFFDYYNIWVFLWFSLNFLIFLVIPFVEIILYKNGTFFQRIFLILSFIGLSIGFLLSYSMDIGVIFITLFLIVFLNISSKTLQESPNFHPIVSKYYILNVCLILLELVILFILIQEGWYLEIIVSQISLIILMISSIVYDKDSNDFGSILFGWD